jgi:IS5 family transposase
MQKQIPKGRAPTKRRTSPKPTKTAYSTLCQLVQWIPAGLIESLAVEHGLDIRGFKATSHVVALMYGQLDAQASLNGICDAAQVHGAEWRRIRGAQPPCRNTFSNANRHRDPAMAEHLYWEVFASLRNLSPSFGRRVRLPGFLKRMNREVSAIDSSTIKLALNCIDWARHRRKKAAAKLHLRLDVSSALPAFAVVEDAAHHDSVRAAALCARLLKGDVLVADRAYNDFRFLAELDERGVSFVVREKKNTRVVVLKRNPAKHKRIIADEIVELQVYHTKARYPRLLRRITARVEVNGKDVEMSFLTNNLDWSAWTIAEIYKARWAIEIFFKELKQTCQIHDFVGYNESAVKWQVWVGLLVHLLMRFIKHVSKWGLSFSRLVGIVRSAIWVKRDLMQMLAHYGIAGERQRDGPVQKPPYIQELLPLPDLPYGTA